MTNKKSSKVQLGFCVPVENREQYSLVGHRTRRWNDWDGGQIGGVPSWLAGPPAPVDDNDDDAGPPTCQVCHAQMDFVGQLYAPKDDDDMPHAFHRTLYIFGCPVDNDQVTVWRCNVPRDNPYWPYRGDEEEEEDLDHGDANNTANTPLCVVCGFPSSARGGVCPVQNLPFCSRAHQQYHYYYYHHHHSGVTMSMEQAAAADHDDDDDVPLSPPEQQRGIYTPMYELAVEEEEYDDESDDDNDDGNVETVPAGDQPEPNSDEEKDDPDAYLEQADLNAALLGRDGTAISQSERDDEAVYERFRDRIAYDKNQVLRYGGDVLWMTAQYPKTIIPPCDHCGQPRQYEFQLMPQLLHYLKRARQQQPPPAVTAAFDGANDGLLFTRVELEEWSAAAVRGSAMTSTTTTVTAETAPPADPQRQQRLLLDDRPELDWGVVAVYTCRTSCSSQYRYVPEYAHVQPSIASLSS